GYVTGRRARIVLCIPGEADREDADGGNRRGHDRWLARRSARAVRDTVVAAPDAAPRATTHAGRPRGSTGRAGCRARGADVLAAGRPAPPGAAKLVRESRSLLAVQLRERLRCDRSRSRAIARAARDRGAALSPVTGAALTSLVGT